MNNFKNGSGIYQIRNIINNKKYIGSAIDLKNRRRQHFFELRHNNHYSKHLQNSYNKYGEENFNFEVLEYVDNPLILTDREQYYIDLYDVTNANNGYNILKYAHSALGFRHNEASKKKMSESKKGKHLESPREPPSQETRNKISATLKGNIPWNKGGTFGKEARKKMSESRKGKIPWNKGLPWNNEMKKKLSDSHKGIQQSEETKRKRSETLKKNPPNKGKKFLTQENKRYGIKMPNASSKYIGVSIVKLKSGRIKWAANISYNGERIYLGKFDSEIDAAIAYNKKASELYGGKAKLNIIIDNEEKEE